MKQAMKFDVNNFNNFFLFHWTGIGKQGKEFGGSISLVERRIFIKRQDA